MPEFALQTDPCQQVYFESEKLGSEPVSAVVKITNTTSKTVAWKVKCTSNEMFRICTPVGMLAPQGSRKVIVIFKPGKQIPEHSKHYFVVYYISAKDDLSAKKPPRKLWAGNANAVPEGYRRLYVSFKKKSPAARIDEGQLRIFCLKAIETGVEGLAKEFARIKAETSTATPKTAFNANKPKNRYQNVVCDDQSRVILKWPPRNLSDYVHANWVEFRGEKKLICTQGPTEATIDDFWRLVWQEKCKAIIMLCEFLEQNKKKCEKYWPADEENSIKTISGLTIKNVNVTQAEEVLTVSRLQLSTKEPNVEPLEVMHIKWNNWPDRGVPKQKMTPFHLFARIRNLQPVLVHCSAGIGRTGTVVGILMAVQVLEAKESLSMVVVVKGLRNFRHGAVQTDVQYVYMHRALINWAETKDLITAAEVRKFSDDYEAFCRARG